MQFSCDSCKTQLQIADEKVRGKRLIVRCRRCGAKIALADPALPKSSPRVISSPDPAVRAPAPAAAPAGNATSPAGGDGRGTDVEITRAMESEVLERALHASAADAAPQNGAQAQQGSAPVAAPAGAAIWFAMLHGKQTGPLTRKELEARASEGEVGPRTYLWREGMDSWQRARDVAELGPMFPQFPGSLLPPSTPAPTPAPGPPTPAPAPARQPTSALVRHQPPPPPAPTWQMGEGAAADDLREPVPVLPDRGPADVARELFASGEHSISQKNAMDLARWATDELGRKKEHAPDPPRISPPVIPPAAQMFESAAPRRGRGTVIIFLGLAALAGTALVLWMLLSSSELRDEPHVRPPAPAQQQPQPSPEAAPKPAEAQPVPQPKPAEPAPQPAPAAATGLTADQVHRKLDESKPALQSCIDSALRRDPKLRVGKIHVATTIAPSGQVTAVRIDKRAVDDSPLGSCLKRATKSIAFPPFAGAPFDVDIPIVVTAGE